MEGDPKDASGVCESVCVRRDSNWATMNRASERLEQELFTSVSQSISLPRLAEYLRAKHFMRGGAPALRAYCKANKLRAHVEDK